MAFRLADDVLRQGIQGISELITQPGLINVDFAHIRNMMKNGGGSLLSIGTGEGENKIIQALEHALHHPMLETINLSDAHGIIANFTGGSDLSFIEVMEACKYLQDKTNADVEIIPGVITDDRMEDRVQVILVLTGIGATSVDSHQVGSLEPTMQFTKSAQSTVTEPAMHTFTPTQVSQPQYEMVNNNDLDVPAFLRHRTN
jgi:cell division protein FtsZ